MDKLELADLNGLTLMQLLQERPALLGLNKLLFPNGPIAGEVIEITGDAGSGKTYILMDLVAKCLLPSKYAQEIGGLDSGVVLFNLDQHFNMFRLVRMMEVRIRRRLKEITENEVEKIISSSLKRLLILNVYSDEEFHLALLSARHHLLLDSRISLLIMDSIGANYWKSVATSGIQKMDTYVSDIIKLIRRTFGSSKITFLYTRPSFLFSKGRALSELSSSYDLKETNTRIKLKLHSRADRLVRLAEVHTSRTVSIVFYELNENGIDWCQ